MFNLNKMLIQQALDLSPVATIIVDQKNHPKPVVYVNQAFEALSGYDAAELIGHPWHELLAEDSEEDAEADQVAKVTCHPRLGATDKMMLDLLPLYDKPGKPRYWVGTEQQLSIPDVSDKELERDALLAVLRDARMHLRRLDGRDSTTGLLNKRAFEDMLERDWVLARRDKRNLSLMSLRVDALDSYREVFGRHAADSCLGKIAHAITGSLRRAGDLAARYSDDQFVVLIGKCDAKDAQKLADAIADKVRGLAIHHPRSDVDRFVTISYGVESVVPVSGLTAASLIEKAQLDMQDEPAQHSGFRFV
jgi:diguanylate cyclase (GGDEF)-like protein